MLIDLVSSKALSISNLKAEFMKNIKIEFKWAIIFVLMTLVWMTLERALGYHSTKIESSYFRSNQLIMNK